MHGLWLAYAPGVIPEKICVECADLSRHYATLTNNPS